MAPLEETHLSTSKPTRVTERQRIPVVVDELPPLLGVVAGGVSRTILALMKFVESRQEVRPEYDGNATMTTVDD